MRDNLYILYNEGNCYNNCGPSYIDQRGCKKETNMVTKFIGKYVVDEKGTAVSVLLDIKTYRRLIAELEDLDL